jgi:hypothetical protein
MNEQQRPPFLSKEEDQELLTLHEYVIMPISINYGILFEKSKKLICCAI